MITYQTIATVLSVGSVAFGIFLYFRDPQIKLEKGESLMARDISQLQSDLANLRDNHVHHLQDSINETNMNVNKMAIEVTRLGTIIEERIPKK